MNIDFSKTDFSKFSDEAIELAFNESTKLMQETLTSFREITNKSFVALAMFASVLAYYYEKDERTHENVLLISASIISIITIWFNLMPSKLSFVGAEPKDTIHEFYVGKENQVRELLITKLLAHHDGIRKNMNVIIQRNKRFKIAATIVVAGFVLAFLLSLVGL